MAGAARRATSTSNFGVGRRESHDASGFYARFEPPELSDDDTVLAPVEVDAFIGTSLDDRCRLGDARKMEAVPDGSVALVVTSPPYFAGKAYEEELERDGIPSSYSEYLQLLEDVFAECARTLEPGGRLAVNVANLGRRPYRSLSADVIDILQNRLRLLLRGEIIWQKGKGAGGNCAWGSFMQPTNPTIRDLTERIVVASKGRFDRARSAKQREHEGLPHRTTIPADLYMETTLDLWDVPPVSAKRIGHPAPFPVELPERLIHTYTWVDDLVLDPFMGAGSTMVAAARTGRRFVGFDLEEAYVDLARERVARSLEGVPAPSVAAPAHGDETVVPYLGDAEDPDFQARATRQGKAAKLIAERVLVDAGFTIVARKVRLRGLGVQVDLELLDEQGGEWLVDVSGAFGNPRGGLRRTDTLFKALGRAHVIRSDPKQTAKRLLFLSSHLPAERSEGDRALRTIGSQVVFDAIAMLSDAGRHRLGQYAAGGFAPTSDRQPGSPPLPGYWTAGEIDAHWRL